MGQGKGVLGDHPTHGAEQQHRRPARTAAMISSGVGPFERSRAFNRATICSIVGRAAILASSAATYADSDLPSPAARSLRVAATSSETSRMCKVVIQPLWQSASYPQGGMS